VAQQWVNRELAGGLHKASQKRKPAACSCLARWQGRQLKKRSRAAGASWCMPALPEEAPNSSCLSRCWLLNLAHCYPTSRPGDLCIECKPSYVSPPLLPFAKVAVDVRITNSFPLPSDGDPNYTVAITHHLQKAEREKFHCPSVSSASTFVNGEMVI